jgi:hypothetical protein
LEASGSNLSTEAEAANLFLEASINSIEGGEAMVENFASALKKTGSELGNNKKLI